MLKKLFKVFSNPIWVCVLFGILLPVYHDSSYSIFLSGPLLKALVDFFYFLFNVVPRDFYISCGVLCFPNIFAPILLILSYIWIYIFARFVNWLLEFIPKLNKWLGFLLVITVISILGAAVEQSACINSFKHPTEGPRSYLYDTGVITFLFTNWPGDIAANWFYKFNGLTYLSSRIVKIGGSKSAIIAKVPVGQEFAKICQIKSYSENLIYKGIDPLTAQDLTTNNSLWQYIDPHFCETNQIDPNVCYSHISK